MVTIPAPVLSLVETSPPQTSPCPISVSELRTHLRLPEYSPPITTEDARLQMLLDAAWQEAAGRQNRDLTPLEWWLTVYPPLPREIQLRADCASIGQVVSVADDGAQSVVDPATYYLDSQRSRLVWLSLPDVGRYVRIRHSTSGLASLPDYLRYGVLLLAAYWYQLGWPVADKFAVPPHEYPVGISHLLSAGAFPSACPR